MLTLEHLLPQLLVLCNNKQNYHTAVVDYL